MELKTRRPPISDFFRSIGTPENLLIWALFSIGAGAAGPFGTYGTMEIIPRTIYWATVTGVALLLGNFARFVVVGLIGVKNLLLGDAFTAVLAVIFVAPVLWFVTLQIPHLDMADVPSSAQFFGYVCLGTIAVVILRRIIVGPDGRTLYEAQGVVVKGGKEPEFIWPRLAGRLCDTENKTILRLTVRDHLVDVISDRKTETLRMRFADAINEMDPVKGYSTHRSHWVTHDAIEDVLYEPGGKVFLRLRNGDKVPVSRKYRPDLEDAGFV